VRRKRILKGETTKGLGGGFLNGDPWEERRGRPILRGKRKDLLGREGISELWTSRKKEKQTT